MDVATPTLAGQYLGEILERLRVSKGITPGEAGDYIGKAAITIRRWEAGRHTPDVSNLRSLAQLYGATGDQLAQLTTLATESKSRGLLEGVNVPPHLRLLVESEHTAAGLHSLELLVIPGLLQTPSYLRAVQRAQLPASVEEAQQIRQLRAQRQAVVFGRDPMPELRFIIGASALSFIEHIPDVYADQVAHLLTTNRLPSVEIRVIRQLHAGLAGSFTVITPADRGGGVRPFAYVESIAGLAYYEQSEQVKMFAETYTAVAGLSVPLKEYVDDSRKMAQGQ